jgi:TolB-like protein/class 3 adenylate cyclase/Tfp pilus assembly protein PilF
MPPVRRLTAILAADVAGYSRLMGADEEGTHERLKAHLGELVEPKISQHRGRTVKNTGDGLLAEFVSVVDAVRCAVEIQRGMAEREPEVPEQQRIGFRIGINLGDVIVDEHDIFGDGVNVAARLEALAEPGGICVSRVVHDQVRDKLDFAFEDMGEQQVKNIARPVRVYVLRPGAGAEPPASRVPIVLPRRRRGAIAALAGVASVALVIAVVAWWGWPATRTASTPPAAVAAATTSIVQPLVAPRLSIVVLPFANLSNDPDQEYFADGITDDLTTDLSRISDTFVIARDTAFNYKGKAIDVKQMGHELGVRYILEGSVRRAGDQVQLNVELIDAENGAHVWADRFETDRANLTKAQNEITGRLARTLHLELLEAATFRVEQDNAGTPDARDLVMRGWAWFYRTASVANREEARRAFELALQIDPGSVGARVGIASTLVSNLLEGWSNFVQEDQTRAEKLLLEVFERDANNPVAHWAMGMLRRVQNRLAEARIEFETATALDRNSRSFAQLGFVLMYLGQPEAAIPNIQKAIRLSPHDPNIYASYGGLGICELFLGHIDEAIDLLRKARAANPRIYSAHLFLAGALGLKGDLDDARLALSEAIKLKPDVTSLARWHAYRPWETNPQYWALREKTLNVGLRRAGFPDE